MREAVREVRTQALKLEGRREGRLSDVSLGLELDEERESIIPARMAIPIVPIRHVSHCCFLLSWKQLLEGAGMVEIRHTAAQNSQGETIFLA